MPTAKFWSIFLGSFLFTFLFPDKAGSQDIDVFTHATKNVISGFRRIYCPALSDDEARACSSTPIDVPGSWGFSASAAQTSTGPRIEITAGVAVTFDALATVYIVSSEVTGKDSCFQAYAYQYAKLFFTNTNRISHGLAPQKAENIIEFATSHRAICDGIDEDSAREAISDNSEFKARIVEAGLVFVLLHELGHVVHRDINSGPVELDVRRERERKADLYAVRAASMAKQHLIIGMMPLFLAMIQGNSLDWENNSDHPLGIRRAVEIGRAFRSEYQSNVGLRNSLPADQYAELRRELDMSIDKMAGCLQKIDNGESTLTCE